MDTVTTDAGRAAVTERLAELFTQWPAEQALQFTADGVQQWSTWGDVARLHDDLSEVLIASRVCRPMP